MISERSATYLFMAFMMALSLTIALKSIGICEISTVGAAIKKDEAAGCIDFWLNRYQTMVVGIASVGAASIAALFVWQQLAETRKQTDMAIGNLDPDIMLMDGNFRRSHTNCHQERRPQNPRDDQLGNICRHRWIVEEEMTRRRDIVCPREPIGLSAEESAAYLGVSPTTFRTAVEKGILPSPYELLGRLVWDAEELHSALRHLPRQNGKGHDATQGEVDWSDCAA